MSQFGFGFGIDSFTIQSSQNQQNNNNQYSKKSKTLDKKEKDIEKEKETYKQDEQEDIPLQKDKNNQKLDSWSNIQRQDQGSQNNQNEFINQRGGRKIKQQIKIQSNFGQDNQSFVFNQKQVKILKENVSYFQVGEQNNVKIRFDEGFGFQSEGDGFGMESNKQTNIQFQQQKKQFNKKDGFGFQGYRAFRQGQDDHFGSGYRGGRGRGRGRGGRGGRFDNNRNFNSGFDNQNFGFRQNTGFNQNQGGGFNQNAGGFNRNPGSFNQNNNFNQGFNQRNFASNRMSNNVSQNNTEVTQPKSNKPEIQKVQEKLKVDQQQQIPQKYLCWPQIQIYAMGKQISFTERPLHQHSNSDILVIPFFTMKLELYGGNIVSSCSMNYRKKISQKIQKGAMSYGGDPYFQKVVGTINFKVLAFMYIDPNNIQQSLLSSLQKMFVILQNQTQIPQQKIIIPLCMQLKPFSGYFKKTIQRSNSKGIKKVLFSMIEQGCFKECLKSYSEVYQHFRQENLISLI